MSIVEYDSNLAPAAAAAGLGVGAIIAIVMCGGVLPILLCCWCCYRICRSDRVVIVNAGGGGQATVVNVAQPSVMPQNPGSQGFAYPQPGEHPPSYK